MRMYGLVKSTMHESWLKMVTALINLHLLLSYSPTDAAPQFLYSED